jgi:hypothetical protein
LWTNTTPAIDTSRSGYFTRRMAHLVELDDLSACCYAHIPVSPRISQIKRPRGPCGLFPNPLSTAFLHNLHNLKK